MKAKIHVILLCLLLLPAWASAEVMSIQVKKGQIRSKASFLGKVVKSAGYGAQVSILKRQGAWYQVKSGGATGWMHKSALSSKKISLKAGRNVGASASGRELALAGKGFNSEVEAEFKNRNRNISFKWVNQMEKINISPREMQTFLKQGGITPAGDGS